MAEQRTILARDMVPGDIVTFQGSESNSFMHIAIYRRNPAEGYVQGWRPYIHVIEEIEIPYVGIEEITFHDHDTKSYVLLRESRKRSKGNTNV